MKKRKLGQSGLEVSAIGFGCMALEPVNGSGRGPAHLTHQQQIAVIRAAHDFGSTLFDVAADDGKSNLDLEAVLGEAVAPFRSRVAVATRFSVDRREGAMAGPNNRPEHIRQAAEASLRRLNLEAIDVFYLHRADAGVPVEDVAGAVQDLIRQGKVKHFGLCETSAASIRRAHAVQPVSVVRAAYSLWHREPEAYLLPTLEELRIGFVASSPLAGAVTRDLHDGCPRSTPQARPANEGLLAQLAVLAERRHATPAQLALAWLLAQKPWIVPVPGARGFGQADENIGGADLQLTADDLRDIAAVRANTPVPGPHRLVQALDFTNG